MKYIYLILVFLHSASPLCAMEKELSNPEISAASSTAIGKVTLQFSDSADGEIGATISRAEANTSGLLENMLKDIGPTDSPIPLPAITKSLWESSIAPVLNILSEKIEHGQKIGKIKDSLNGQVPSKSFGEAIAWYVKMLNAADYLDIPDLVTIATEQLTHFLKNESGELLTNPHLFDQIDTLNPAIADEVKKKMDAPQHISTINCYNRLTPVALAFAIRKKTFLCAYRNISPSTNVIEVWNIADKAHPRHISIVNLEASVSSNCSGLTISPDEQTLYVVYERSIQLWDMSNPERIQPVSRINPRTLVLSTVLSADGSTLYAGLADNTIQIWNVTDRTNPLLINTIITRHNPSFFSLALSADGAVLYSAYPAGAWYWESNTLHVQPSGYTERDIITMWNVTDQRNPRLVSTIDNNYPAPTRMQRQVHMVSSANGSTLIVLSSSLANPITLWNTADRQHAAILSRIAPARSTAVSLLLGADEKRLLVSSSDSNMYTVQWWDISSLKSPRHIGTLDRPENPRSYISAFSSDSNVAIALGFIDGKIELWNVGFSLPELTLSQAVLVYQILQHYSQTDAQIPLSAEVRVLFNTLPELIRNELSDIMIKKER